MCLDHICSVPYNETKHWVYTKKDKNGKTVGVFYAVKFVMNDWAQTNICVTRNGVSIKLHLFNQKDVIDSVNLPDDLELLEAILKRLLNYNVNKLSLVKSGV